MGRAPCCDKDGLKKGPWTPEEDQKLTDYIQRHGHGSWRTLPKHAGLLRCGKSCRLRWTNYLRPDIKRGKFSFEEEQTIVQLHGVLGNKWSAIASHLPGRTDNEIKNYWNTHLKKRLLQMGIDPVTHRPRIDLFNFSNMTQLLAPASLSHMAAQWERARLEAVTTDYLRVLAAYRSAAMMQQGSHSHSSTMDADHLMSYLRNQLGDAAFCNMPDNMNSAMAQANWALNSENLGSSDSNALATQIIMEQLQVPAAQIMRNLQSQTQNTAELSACSLPLNGTSMTQNSSPTSTLSSLDGFHTLKAEQRNNNSNKNNVPNSHDSTKINNHALLQDQGYDNLMNASASLLQQHSRSQDNNSLSTDQLVTSPILWPEEQFLGISKNNNSESVPALVSTTSSPNIFNDTSDMFHDASPVQNSQNCMRSDCISTNGYGLPADLFLDFGLDTTKQQNVETMAPATSTTHVISGSSSWSEMQNSHEDGGDYWSNMLKYVGESSISNSTL